MIPLILAAFWPPFAAATLWYRGDHDAVHAGWLVAAVCAAVSLYAGWMPAAAVSAGWMVAGVAWTLSNPGRLSRRERRREHRRRVLEREAAWGPVFDAAREELDSADELVPVILRAPRRVALTPEGPR